MHISQTAKDSLGKKILIMTSDNLYKAVFAAHKPVFEHQSELTPNIISLFFLAILHTDAHNSNHTADIYSRVVLEILFGLRWDEKNVTQL